jgi:hypothetical protein
MSRIFIDLDGTLADFDLGHERAFGARPDKEKDDVDWERVRETPNFYRDLPPMGDYRVLWNAVKHHRPIILTGVPKDVPEAAGNKLAWVNRVLGPVDVICCRSKDKASYCSPGDVLVDDWEKHRALWEAAGGHWVTHTSAAESLRQLKELGFSVK